MWLLYCVFVVVTRYARYIVCYILCVWVDLAAVCVLGAIIQVV